MEYTIGLVIIIILIIVFYNKRRKKPSIKITISSEVKTVSREEQEKERKDIAKKVLKDITNPKTIE